MATAMKGVTSALTSMNKKMDLPGLQKVMNEFMKENERSEMIQEVLGDTLDDAMEEEGSAGQEETIVNQVLPSPLTSIHYVPNLLILNCERRKSKFTYTRDKNYSKDFHINDNYDYEIFRC
jgi:hypothetical protein